MSVSARRLLLELEQVRREINRNTINPEIRELTLEELEPLVSAAAQMRAAYVQTLFDIVEQGNTPPSREDIERLRERRTAFDEFVFAINALETMIDRGYVDAGAGESATPQAAAVA